MDRGTRYPATPFVIAIKDVDYKDRELRFTLCLHQSLDGANRVFKGETDNDGHGEAPQAIIIKTDSDVRPCQHFGCSREFSNY
jgi:hypothetical protein